MEIYIIMLITIYYLLFTYLSHRRLEWAIYLVILTLPTYLIRFSLGPIPMTFLEGEILILFVLWLLKNNLVARCSLLVASYKNHKSIVHAITLLILATTISVFISPDIRAAAGIWKAYFIEPVLFLIVFLNTITSKKQVVRAFWFLGLSIIMPGIIAIYQQFTGLLISNPFWAAEATRRVTSVYGYPNAIGLYFAPIIAGAIAILIHKFHQVIKKTLPEKERTVIWWKIVAISAIIIIGLSSILFAHSRGAILGIAATMLFYALFWRGKRLFFASVIIIGLISLFGLIHPISLSSSSNPQFTSNQSKITLSNPSTITGGSSLEIRLDQYRETWTMLKTRSLLGAGLAGYQTRLAPFHEKPYIEIFLYPHNILLTFWSETGLLGLLAFLWLIFIFFKLSNETIKQYNNENPWQSHIPIAITGSTVALLVHGLVDVPYFKNDLSMLFWMLFGLMLVLKKPNVYIT